MKMMLNHAAVTQLKYKLKVLTTNEEFDDDGDGSSTDQHRRIDWGSSYKIWWVDAADEEKEYSSWDIGINNNISRKVKDEMEDRLF
ncbi:hypothetical protein CUMW_050810 [Citrus unshiu]|nr:hypothetical protein CUMW_050810 [Citrus unshiu]